MEYLVVTIDYVGRYQRTGFEWASINELGEAGWELVTVAFENGDTARGFFKRIPQPHFVKTVAVLQGDIGG